MRLCLMLAMVATANVLAAPPELVDKGPVIAPVKEPTFFTVKADPGKKLVSAPTYDTKAFIVVRIWTDDVPGVYTFQAFPKKPGTYHVPFFQDGEKPLVVEVRTSESEVTPTPPPDVEPSRKDMSYRVVFIEETSEAANGRGAMLTDKVLAARMKEKGHTFRTVDKDVKDAFGNVPADLKPLLEAAAKKKYPQVFFVDKANKLPTFQFDVPENAADLLKLLAANGG